MVIIYPWEMQKIAPTKIHPLRTDARLKGTLSLNASTELCPPKVACTKIYHPLFPQAPTNEYK